MSENAVLVIDMQKDNVGRFCLHIIPKIKILASKAREKGFPVVYVCDTRLRDDPMFTRFNLPPHTIKGTSGWEVIDEISPEKDDIIVEKPRLSAFYASNLDFLLRYKRIKTLIISGIRTEGCVLKTIMDGLELGYEIILPVDCVASPSKENHEATLKILNFFLVKKTTVEELIKSFDG
ncbi:MAG: cysteine hydrolase [Candidatus Bathyarchaeota archaeon]|nr:cysteine hydrolase [Candidatus Bathyarchaeota archaeon]